ncbi:hypothetical protein BDV93DRAFT_559133 [Ceratobasidium sp. AG-I]|nr:hypothetical protein BDV93DRAFT_559133 [Ceratobasidium sp. AG-I]
MDAPLVNRRVVQASGMRIHSHHHAAETTGTNYSNSASDVLFSLVPAVGSDIKGRRCMFAHRTWRTTISLKSYRSNVNAEETVWTSTRSRHIHSLAHNRALFSTLLAEVLDLAQLGDEGRTDAEVEAGDWEWCLRRVEPRVESDDVVYGTWRVVCRARIIGTPYRRGYLLHGPPGSGKSSFIQALAGSSGHNTCVLNISERGLVDYKPDYLLAHVPKRNFVLLDDIGATFNTHVRTSRDGCAFPLSAMPFYSH